MQLTKKNIHIWQRSLLAAEAEVTDNFKILSLDEQKQADRFKFAHHRRRFIIARATLRQILSQYLGTHPAALQFAYGEKQKPYLANNRLQFNLTHSYEYAMYALRYDDPIGIDLEKVNGHDTAALAKRYFSVQEQTQLTTAPDQDKNQLFYRIWTRKEALLKADGRGLGISLASFNVTAQDRIETVAVPPHHWLLFPIEAPANYLAAAATLAGPTQVLTYEFFHADHIKLIAEYDIMTRYQENN